MKKKKLLAEKKKGFRTTSTVKNLTLVTIDVMYTYILEQDSENTPCVIF